MVEDVERVTRAVKPISFFGRCGGIVPSPEEVLEAASRLFDEGDLP
jgi:hypothetical protein